MYNNVSEWDFEIIIQDARNHPEIDEEFYAKLLTIQTNPDTIGNVLRTGHFAEWVESGFVTSYDGHGYYMKLDGTQGPPVGFNPKYIRKQEKEYPLVQWCNR